MIQHLKLGLMGCKHKYFVDQHVFAQIFFSDLGGGGGGGAL